MGTQTGHTAGPRLHVTAAHRAARRPPRASPRALPSAHSPPRGSSAHSRPAGFRRGFHRSLPARAPAAPRLPIAAPVYTQRRSAGGAGAVPRWTAVRPREPHPRTARARDRSSAHVSNCSESFAHAGLNVSARCGSSDYRAWDGSDPMFVHQARRAGAGAEPRRGGEPDVRVTARRRRRSAPAAPAAAPAITGPGIPGPVSLGRGVAASGRRCAWAGARHPPAMAGSIVSRRPPCSAPSSGWTRTRRAKNASRCRIWWTGIWGR